MQIGLLLSQVILFILFLGFIFDETSSYEVAFIISGCSSLGGATLMTILSFVKCREEHSLLYQESPNKAEERGDDNIEHYSHEKRFDEEIHSKTENLNVQLIIKETSL